MMMTRCQDHNLTENIWFVWSKTSYSGDVTDAGRLQPNNFGKDRATQPMDARRLSFAKTPILKPIKKAKTNTKHQTYRD